MTVPADLPNVTPEAFSATDLAKLRGPRSSQPPRIPPLYGSLREVSYSLLLTFEVKR